MTCSSLDRGLILSFQLFILCSIDERSRTESGRPLVELQRPTWKANLDATAPAFWHWHTLGCLSIRMLRIVTVLGVYVRGTKSLQWHLNVFKIRKKHISTTHVFLVIHSKRNEPPYWRIINGWKDIRIINYPDFSGYPWASLLPIDILLLSIWIAVILTCSRISLLYTLFSGHIIFKSV
jgi:hypothetical protein